MDASSNQKEDRLDRISNALLAGRKIEAIKAYQEMTGLGLRECKEAIDAMESSLKIKQPESFTTTKQKSPLPVVAIVVALILAGVVFAMFSGK